MDTRTGKIVPLDLLKNLPPEEQKFFIEMKVLPTPVQLLRKVPRVGRNEPCPCGSGKKFKYCHLLKEGGHDHDTE